MVRRGLPFALCVAAMASVFGPAMVVPCRAQTQPETSPTISKNRPDGINPKEIEHLQYWKISQSIIESRLEKYEGTDLDREAALRQMFKESGCGDHISEQRIPGLDEPNLICVLPGATTRTIFVGAHFDHQPDNDGVVDNWSGASLLPSLYQSLKATDHAHTYVFVAFAGEKMGAAGSSAYVQQMTKKQIAEADAMVSLEDLGLGPTEIWVTRSDQPLSLRLLYLADVLGTTVSAATTEPQGGADVEQFAQRKIPRIAIETSPESEEDRPDPESDDLVDIDPDAYYASYSLIAPFIDYLDNLTAETSRTIEPAPPASPPPDPLANPFGSGRGPGRPRGR